MSHVIFTLNGIPMIDWLQPGFRDWIHLSLKNGVLIFFLPVPMAQWLSHILMGW